MPGGGGPVVGGAGCRLLELNVNTLQGLENREAEDIDECCLLYIFSYNKSSRTQLINFCLKDLVKK